MFDSDGLDLSLPSAALLTMALASQVCHVKMNSIWYRQTLCEEQMRLHRHRPQHSARDPWAWWCLSASPSHLFFPRWRCDSSQPLHLWSCRGRLPRKAWAEVHSIETQQRQCREKKWHVARYLTLVPLGQEGASSHLLACPQKGLMPNEVHWTVLGKIPQTSQLSWLWAPHSLHPIWKGAFWLFFESWNHFAGWILPYLGKEVLCCLNEVHGEERQAKCLPRVLFVHDLVVLSFFFLFASSNFKLK